MKLCQYSNPWKNHFRIWYDRSCSALAGITSCPVKVTISRVILGTPPHKSTGWSPIWSYNGNGASLWWCGLHLLSGICLGTSMVMWSSEVLYRKSLVNGMRILPGEILHLEKLKSPLENEQSKIPGLGSPHWLLYHASYMPGDPY